MTGRELIVVLIRNGWTLDRINSSHHVLIKPGQGNLSVPVHGSKDLKKGTIHGILKKAGLARR
jgi:predicted RNA binding protein YcfA (HicA-like mRNA interferase family)